MYMTYSEGKPKQKIWGWVTEDTGKEDIIIPMQHLKSWGVKGENFPNINMDMFNAKGYDSKKLAKDNLAAVRSAVKQIEDGIKGESDMERLRQKLISDFSDVFSA